MFAFDNKFVENNFVSPNNDMDNENITITNNLDEQLAEALEIGPGGPGPKQKKAIAKITSISGTVKKGDNKKAWSGTTLTEDDTIVVGQDGYVGLMSLSSGKTIEIKQAGTYKIKDLVDKANASTKSMTKIYGEYVLEKMTEDRSKVNRKVQQGVQR